MVAGLHWDVKWTPVVCCAGRLWSAEPWIDATSPIGCQGIGSLLAGRVGARSEFPRKTKQWRAWLREILTSRLTNYVTRRI